jgi:type VI secretion system secreted protein VgrG
VVVGPQGSKNIAAGGDSDLYADGLGRVRVRFPWQREVPTGANQSGSTDPLQTDRRTCWVSVSESWAGANFGTQFLPRIGQEVIVSFLDGDPERPIITGRRYNADHGFSNLPFPPDEVDVEIYDINAWNTPGPSNNFPFSGIKTASTKTARADSSGGKSRYHLMRFDDTYNCEQLLLRSQGRLDVTAYASNFDTAYGNRNLKTAKGTDKDGKPIGGNMFNTIAGEYDVHVGGSHYTQVEKDYELTVKGDVKADLKGALTAVIKGDVSISMNSLVIEATQKITLKVGGSFIVIDPCEVHLNGCNVYKTPSGSADGAASVTLQNIADATAAEPGDKWNARLTPCSAPAGHGGSRGTHGDSPTPAPSCASLHGGSVNCNFLPPDGTSFGSDAGSGGSNAGGGGPDGGGGSPANGG